jgi:hypothetical protein
MHAGVTTHFNACQRDNTLEGQPYGEGPAHAGQANGRKDRHLPSWQAWRTVAPVLDTSRKGTKWGVNSQIASVGRRFYVS